MGAMARSTGKGIAPMGRSPGHRRVQVRSARRRVRHPGVARVIAARHNARLAVSGLPFGVTGWSPEARFRPRLVQHPPSNRGSTRPYRVCPQDNS